MPSLVKLSIIRQVALRDNAENLTGMDYDRCVVQLMANPERSTNDDGWETRLARHDKLGHGRLNGIQKRILLQKVINGVG